VEKPIVMFPDWDLTKVLKEVELLQTHDHYVVVDIETTGAHPEKGAEIIQIAAIQISKGEVLDYFSTFVKPQNGIPWSVFNRTGIMGEDVRDAPYLEDALWEFWRFLGDTPVIVAHNVKFNWDRFLFPVMRECGIPVDPETPTFCTLKTYRRACPDLNKALYKNDAMAWKFGYTLEGANRADTDVVATAWVFLRLFEWFNAVDLQDLRRLKREKWLAKIPVEIISVNRWEKQVNPKTLLRRFYVDFKAGGKKGTAFYDLNRHEWGLKDFKGGIHTGNLERAVLERLGLSEVSELETYAG